MICSQPGCDAEVEHGDLGLCGYQVGESCVSGYGCGRQFCGRHLWVTFDADWPYLCAVCLALAAQVGEGDAVGSARGEPAGE